MDVNIDSLRIIKFGVVLMRYLIDFSYSGFLFNGYQRQPGLRTVQNEIEKVLTMINGDNKVVIYSAGRTDAKVNALHQTAHFDLDKTIPTGKIKMALNSYLPDDIYINSVTKVADNFHARYLVKSKLYEYKINTKEFNPLLRTHVYQYGKPLNVKKIRKALEYLKGTHDFTTFTCAEDKRINKMRTILDAMVDEEDGIITISFLGTGFLKYQIRNMIGLLIEIGEGKQALENIPNLFEMKDRRAINLTAPPEGLTLVKVNY